MDYRKVADDTILRLFQRLLVAAGGTGKTAVVERVAVGMKANMLVWSFYERPLRRRLPA